MSRKRIVVVCPGRGSYTKENLGYLQNRPEISSALKSFDDIRIASGDLSITELDQAKTFKTSLHTKGEHASPLIFSCAMADFLTIDQERFDIVAITGNSMGWYLSLAFAGALNVENSFRLIQTMGGMMKDGLIGGQIIYPIVDEEWKISKTKRQYLLDKMEEVSAVTKSQLHISIELGGYLVIGGEQKALGSLLKNLEPVDHFPFQLINHGAFHTPLLNEVSQKAFQVLPTEIFERPKIPLIDGRGHIWQPYSTDIRKLHDYTLGHQVQEKYDFTASISVALREFSPDHLVLLGPGNSLGGAIGQTMIKNGWRGVTNKDQFIEQQKMAPFLLSYGLEEQRKVLVKKKPSPVSEVNC